MHATRRRPLRHHCTWLDAALGKELAQTNFSARIMDPLHLLKLYLKLFRCPRSLRCFPEMLDAGAQL